MVEGVTADQVAVLRDAPGQRRVGLGPAALDEEGSPDALGRQLTDGRGLGVAMVRPVRMLGIEGQGDPKSRGYFSTPLMTMPRVKTPWKAMNSSTGITRVMRVPA